MFFCVLPVLLVVWWPLSRDPSCRSRPQTRKNCVRLFPTRLFSNLHRAWTVPERFCCLFYLYEEEHWDYLLSAEKQLSTKWFLMTALHSGLPRLLLMGKLLSMMWNCMVVEACASPVIAGKTTLFDCSSLDIYGCSFSLGHFCWRNVLTPHCGVWIWLIGHDIKTKQTHFSN